MNDLVERLRAQPTERTYDSVGRAYDFPKHLIEEAASRISQQDAELERLREALEWMAERDDRNGSLPEAYRKKIDETLALRSEAEETRT